MTSVPVALRSQPAVRTPGGSPQRAPEGGKTGGRPRRGRSSRPARRCSKNRLRHCETTSRRQCKRSAIWSLRSPSAASSTIWARMTCQYGNVYERASDSSTRRSSSLNSIRYGLCRGINAPSRDDRMPRTLRPRSDTNTRGYLRDPALSITLALSYSFARGWRREDQEAYADNAAHLIAAGWSSRYAFRRHGRRGAGRVAVTVRVVTVPPSHAQSAHYTVIVSAPPPNLTELRDATWSPGIGTNSIAQFYDRADPAVPDEQINPHAQPLRPGLWRPGE